MPQTTFSQSGLAPRAAFDYVQAFRAARGETALVGVKSPLSE
jgi:hypothetical protein